MYKNILIKNISYITICKLLLIGVIIFTIFLSLLSATFSSVNFISINNSTGTARPAYFIFGYLFYIFTVFLCCLFFAVFIKAGVWIFSKFHPLSINIKPVGKIAGYENNEL
jgi:hypothetical protein